MTAPKRSDAIYLVVSHGRDHADQYACYLRKKMAMNAIREFKAQYKPYRIKWNSPKMEGYRYYVSCSDGMWAGIMELEVIK